MLTMTHHAQARLQQRCIPLATTHDLLNFRTTESAFRISDFGSIMPMGLETKNKRKRTLKNMHSLYRRDAIRVH